MDTDNEGNDNEQWVAFLAELDQDKQQNLLHGHPRAPHTSSPCFKPQCHSDS